MPLFLVSCVSTGIAAFSNVCLVRLFLVNLGEDVLVNWFSFFNIFSNLGLFLVHFMVFGYTTKCENFSRDTILEIFMSKLRICSLIFFLLNIVLLKFFIKVNFNILFLFLLSYFYIFFFVLNAICSTLNNMLQLFFCYILSQIFLVFLGWWLISNRSGTDEIFLIYSLSYFFLCITLFKIIFPYKNCFSFVYYFFFFKKFLSTRNFVSKQNLLFDFMTLIMSIKIFYAKYFFSNTSELASFCLFWKFVEIGKVFLDRIIDSRQGNIVNALRLKLPLFKLLLKYMQQSILLALIGSYLYVKWGNVLFRVLFNYDKDFTNWEWYSGVVFYLQYAIVCPLVYFMFFLNRTSIINKILFINVTIFLGFLWVLRGTNPFYIPFLSLINVTFIPFYWNRIKKFFCGM